MIICFFGKKLSIIPENSDKLVKWFFTLLSHEAFCKQCSQKYPMTRQNISCPGLELGHLKMKFHLVSSALRRTVGCILYKEGTRRPGLSLKVCCQ
ncbi:hypothetical protein Gasu2_04580 [Galdieria sulphuraria]|uniref:Uncharacterized protein n=1 Tax=Galdieria sulphuraria TaxID=130081 RepID=M2WZG1_GALSU|nr:uncharacterized protein Gasu_31110 [Galdieria sulphuraria]EME29470.1 hypothetical protein Gasu_31110 [Galdieria sulphuraria]GJD06017.1 hypothetical protein Gasu2_04580 [Galdieria sulphuraria]|eukprot:XP_005705990.1 hypothetical protein Gasu_31110 [Galdieria sulphuraria]